jgi:hypothetical protein
VRAIVIDNGQTRATIIGADQSNMPDAVWKAATGKITKELECPLAQIPMPATHTHSPGATFRPPDPNAPPTPEGRPGARSSEPGEK